MFLCQIHPLMFVYLHFSISLQVWREKLLHNHLGVFLSFEILLFVFTYLNIFFALIIYSLSIRQKEFFLN